ncbi:MAG: exodeoxyribonuclease VII small subunit [Clostridia bacterium]|nr:exodeoxyribonuclease VII small subunit [Clostridia bacterium]
MENKISYEEAAKQLQEIIDKIENGKLPLDEAVKLFEKGKELISICYNLLDQAKGKLTEIKEVAGKLEEA